jgi:glycosyltransferase involved in cell wall biosynthesis
MRASSRTSAVIPARNEAAAIGDVVRGCLAHVDEVVVVDDASDDATSERARLAGARVVVLGRRGGKGKAMRDGAATASGEVLVFLDGDGQDPTADIPRLLAAIERGADLAIGSRFQGAFEPDAISPIDRLGNRALTAIVRLLYRRRVTDSQAGFKAIRRATFDALELRANGFDIEAELLARAIVQGATIVEVPVTRRARIEGRSRLRRVPDGLRILARIVAVRFSGCAGAHTLLESGGADRDLEVPR